MIPENLSVSSHLNNIFELEGNSLLSEDPEGNKVRSLHFTQLSLSYHMSLEVSRGADETRLRPDEHDVGLRPPCRTRASIPRLYRDPDEQKGGLGQLLQIHQARQTWAQGRHLIPRDPNWRVT